MPMIEKIIWSAPPDLPGVEIISAENNQKAWSVLHKTYTICTMDTYLSEEGAPRPGESVWVSRGKMHYSPNRSMMLLEPGEVHRNIKDPPPCNFFVALIDPHLVNRAAYEAGMNPNPHFKQATTGDPRLYRAFVRFHAALAEQTSLLHSQSLLMNCIGALIAGHCERNPRPAAHPGKRALFRARDFLQEHCTEKISLDQLADIAGLSRFHFLRSFTREFGLPPHAYQVQLRIEHIRLLIKRGVPPHAIEAGFTDQSHLIWQFRRAMGVTPGRYAAMVGMAAEIL